MRHLTLVLAFWCSQAHAAECVSVTRLLVRPAHTSAPHVEVVYHAMLLNSCPQARVVHATLVLRDEDGLVLEQFGPMRYPVRAFGLSRVGERARFRRENLDAARSYHLRLDSPL